MDESRKEKRQVTFLFWGAVQIEIVALGEHQPSDVIYVLASAAFIIYGNKPNKRDQAHSKQTPPTCAQKEGERKKEREGGRERERVRESKREGELETPP